MRKRRETNREILEDIRRALKPKPVLTTIVCSNPLAYPSMIKKFAESLRKLIREQGRGFEGHK